MFAGKCLIRMVAMLLLLMLSPSIMFSQESYTQRRVVKLILDPQKRALLSAEINSKVIKLKKRMGESFSLGDELVLLDRRIFQSEFDKMQALLKKAQTDLKAQKELFQEGSASLSELHEAEAQMAVARADYVQAERNLENCYIKAPYAGEVVSVFVNEYEAITLNQPLIEIVDASVLIGKMLVPARLADRLKLKKEFDIEIELLGTVVKGHLKRIGAVIDPASGLVKVDIEIPNVKKLLKPGMSGKIYF